MSTGLITLKVRAVLQEFKQTIVIEEVQKCISWHFLRMVNCLKKESIRYNDGVTFLCKKQNFTKKVKYIGSIVPLFSL